MDETLELISETQNKLRELFDGYAKETKSIQEQNRDRIEELYGQIMEFIADKFKPYKQFYVCCHNEVHDVASAHIHLGYCSDAWVKLRANSDWTEFFFTRNERYLPEVSHEQIVLNWKTIKEKFLEDLESNKSYCLRVLDSRRRETLKLKEKLDAFEL